MIATTAYRQSQQPTSWARIDLLLALYDGALERLDGALRALKAGDAPAAVPLLARVQAIVLELAAGVRLDVGDPSAVNFLRLYEFFARCLAGTDLPRLESVRRSMATLREGLRGIRQEAVELERSGAVPRVDGGQVIAVG